MNTDQPTPATPEQRSPNQPAFDAGATCPCRTCLERDLPKTDDPLQGKIWWMVVCAICGNKRCPHAKDHRNACTNSNAPGQKGSDYEERPDPTPAAMDCGKMCPTCPFAKDTGDKDELVRMARQSPNDTWPCHEAHEMGEERACAGHKLHSQPAAMESEAPETTAVIADLKSLGFGPKFNYAVSRLTAHAFALERRAIAAERALANNNGAGLRKLITDACPQAKMHSSLINALTCFVEDHQALTAKLAAVEKERDEAVATSPKRIPTP